MAWEWSWHMNDLGILPTMFTQNLHGECGCCSMVAAAAVCTCAFKIKTGNSIELSVQDPINRVPELYEDEIHGYDNSGCASAYTSTSLKYIKEHGIGMLHDLPYSGTRTDQKIPPNRWKLKIKDFTIFNVGTLEENKQYHVDTVENWEQVPHMGGDIFLKKIQQRPLVGEFHMYPTHFMQTYDGIYTNQTRDQSNEEAARAHAVLVTGWGRTESLVPFYICQNSFGLGFGSNCGYIRIAEGEFFNFYDVTVDTDLVLSTD